MAKNKSVGYARLWAVSFMLALLFALSAVIYVFLWNSVMEAQQYAANPSVGVT